MQVKVNKLLPEEKSKSRKVNKYRRLSRELKALDEAVQKKRQELMALSMTLNGSQLAEVSKNDGVV